MECIETSTSLHSEKLVKRWQLVCHTTQAIHKYQQETSKNHKDGGRWVPKQKSHSAETRDPPSQDPGDHTVKPCRHDSAPMHIDHVDLPREWKRVSETMVRHTEWKGPQNNRAKPLRVLSCVLWLSSCYLCSDWRMQESRDCCGLLSRWGRALPIGVVDPQDPSNGLT